MSAWLCVCVSPSPEPEHSLTVPEQAQESQLSVWGEQEGQPGERVHRGAVQQRGGQGDLWEPARDGKKPPPPGSQLVSCVLSSRSVDHHQVFDFNSNSHGEWSRSQWQFWLCYEKEEKKWLINGLFVWSRKCQKEIFFSWNCHSMPDFLICAIT